uniref:TATA-box-binding protein-like n=1 Tax=Crassostrea virginica TaxID=6565 RepID=A0A8B8AAJ8_CRAVI|nr:TATA-box-binding protein-like [Crassostrea virginica]
MATKSVLIPYDKYRRLLSGNRPTSHECGDVQKRQERHRLPKRRISVTPPRRPSPETREGPTLKRPPLPASENEDSTSPESEVPAEAAGTFPPGETGELRPRSADARLNCDLDLRALANALVNVRYDPSRFSGLIWQHRNIGGNCLLFANGKINCNGKCDTIQQGVRRLRRYSRLLQRKGAT